MKQPIDILVDFDGTVVKHEYPYIGGDIGAIETLKDLVSRGHRLILFTMRSTKELEHAVTWFKENQIPLYGIQENPTQKDWTTSPKAYGQLIIDDIGLGIPLVKPAGRRPYVDWIAVREWLFENEYL